jgi:hypothetical protein
MPWWWVPGCLGYDAVLGARVLIRFLQTPRPTLKRATMATQEHKTVAFVLYPGLTLLDLVCPLQVFSTLRFFNDQYRPVVVAERLEPMPTDGPLTVTADQTFGEAAATIGLGG